jgi:cysteine desulfurase
MRLFDKLPPRPDGRPHYFDAAATTPVDPRVAELVMHYMVQEFGNAGSRHSYGSEALKAVNKAREQVAAVIELDDPTGVIFTSGATESNNLAILGLTQHGLETGRKHIISSAIEHKAVLEPLKEMERRGFEVTLIKPQPNGCVDASEVIAALRLDTLLLSIMHVNNELGTIQPLEAIADGLKNSQAFFHTDAAQGFTKELKLLKHSRIDMISMSGHKIGAPKGIGALLMRRRRYKLPPLTPIFFGGGQERGLRSGTQAVPLIAGLGLASELRIKEHKQWQQVIQQWRTRVIPLLELAGYSFSVDPANCLPSLISANHPIINAEACVLQEKDSAVFSTGSTCASSGSTPNHVISLLNNKYSNTIRLSR